MKRIKGQPIIGILCWKMTTFLAISSEKMATQSTARVYMENDNVEQASSLSRTFVNIGDERDIKFLVDGGGGNEDRHLLVATARVGVVLTGAVLVVVPWGVMLVLEEGTRKVLGSSDVFNVRMFAWSYLTVMYDDVVRLSALLGPFSAMRWRFPEELSVDQNGRQLVALTIDDAPGNNPTELGELLDTLKRWGAKATFFCTTNYVTDEMMPLMQRMVEEGHEVANHCPEDRVYHRDSESSFQDSLDESSKILEPFFKHQQTLLKEKGVMKQFKWFRPPSGQMSQSMQTVLSRRGYSNVLGDCFSNDVFVGGTLRHVPAGPNTVAYHASYCSNRVKAGSIVIFHVPQLTERLLSKDVIDAFIGAAKIKGLDCVSLSELALSVDANST
jgi:peptidoglycan/xylan/chitin deacetylase (PgdA/CDA1 family)